MTNRVQVLRSSVAGNIPASGTRQPGEIWTNFPDLQLGVINAGKVAQPLLAVRIFSTACNYLQGDLVSYQGVIWSALGNTPAGPFTPAAWMRFVSAGELGNYLPIAGGIMSGAIVLPGDPTSNLQAATKQYVDTKTSGFLPTSGGTVTGPLTINGNLTQSAGSLTLAPSSPGRIDNTIIGGTTPSAGTFTNLTSANVNLTGGTISSGVSIAGIGSPSTTPPAMDGTASAGTSAAWSRGDHVHPSDTSRLPLTGGTLAGSLTVGGGGTLYVGGNFAVGSNSFMQCNAGAMFWGSGISMTQNAPGCYQIYNAGFRSDYYVGAMGATPNSFGAAPAYVWGIGSWSGVAGGGGAMYDRVDRTDCYMHGFLWGTSSMVGTISTNGSSVSYNSTSDGRWKENVRHLTEEVDVGALIDGIRPVAFDWKKLRGVVGEPGAVLFAPDGFGEDVNADGPKAKIARGTSTGHGFIAQELIEIAPFAVNAPDDGKSEIGLFGDTKRPHTPWGVDFSKLVPYLVAEVQNLRKRVAELEAK